MLSSSDVAAMFAAQNQAFMGQNQYAQQIGISNPNLSLAQMGSDPRQRAFGQQGTWGGNTPVSYAPGGIAGPGYGGGNRFASSGMALAGGAATGLLGILANPIGAFMGGMGLGGAGTTGLANSAANLAGAGGISRGLGGLVGGGLAGGALAAGAVIAPTMAAQHYIGAAVGGAQQQQGIQDQLGGFGFQNSRSRTGQGFTRDDALSIGNNIRQLAHIPEMMTSVDELTKLIPKLKSAGMMQGVRDATDFNSRFKEAVKTLRDVSKVLGSTMEEATQFFEHSRSVGMLGRKDQIRNALNIQFTAAQTGMSTTEVQQMQVSGAGMARSVGGRGEQGVAAITNISNRLEAARQAGTIDENMIMDVTGQGGPAGAKAASERMFGLMLNMRNSRAGRAIIAGTMTRDENGKVKLDEKILDQLNRGDIGIEELRARAENLSQEDKVSFAQRAAGSLGTQFAGSVNIGSFMRRLVGDRGKDAAAKVFSDYTGANEQESDMAMNIGSKGNEERQKQAFILKKKMEADIAERTDPSKILARWSVKLKAGSGTTMAEQEFASLYTHFGNQYDELLDEAFNRYSTQLSEGGAKRLSEAFRSGEGRKALADTFQKVLNAPRYSIDGKAGGIAKLITAVMFPSTLATDFEQASASTQKGMVDALRFVSSAPRGEVGDDPERQRAFLKETYGAHAETDEKLNTRFAELRKMGEGDKAAQQQMQGLIKTINRYGQFTEANSEDRQRMIKEELGEEGKLGSLARLALPGLAAVGVYQDIKQAYKQYQYKDIVEFAKKNNIQVAETGVALTEGLIKNANTSGATMRDMMRNSARNIKAAEAALRGQLGDDAAEISSIMATGGVAGELINEITSGSEKGVKAREVLDKQLSSEEGAKAMSAALGGKEVSEQEYEKIRIAQQRIDYHINQGAPDEKEKKERGVAVTAALSGLWGANTKKDFSAVFDELSKLGEGMKGEGGEKLKKSINRIIGSKSGDEFKKAAEEATQGLSDIALRLMNAKTPEEKNKIYEEVGGRESVLGEYLGRKTEGGSNIRLKTDKEGKTTQKDLATSLGIEESQISKPMQEKFKAYGDKLFVSASDAAKEKADAAGGGLLPVALGQKDKADKDQAPARLIKTLESVDTTLKLLTTGLAIERSNRRVPNFVKSTEQKSLENEEASLTGKPAPHPGVK